MGFYKMALDIHEWTWERGQVIAKADRNIQWPIVHDEMDERDK